MRTRVIKGKKYSTICLCNVYVCCECVFMCENFVQVSTETKSKRELRPKTQNTNQKMLVER